MPLHRPIHADFRVLLDLKSKAVIDLFTGLRQYILELCPGANELLYHTHALTAVFSLSEKLSDAFCMLPIYTGHLNLGFNKGTLLHDPHGLLTGTGNLIRHIDMSTSSDYRKPEVKAMILDAIRQASEDMGRPFGSEGKTLSKIRKS